MRTFLAHCAKKRGGCYRFVTFVNRVWLGLNGLSSVASIKDDGEQMLCLDRPVLQEEK